MSAISFYDIIILPRTLWYFHHSRYLILSKHYNSYQANITRIGMQCRLIHGPNGPLARAPKLLGAPTDATNFFTLCFL